MRYIREDQSAAWFEVPPILVPTFRIAGGNAMSLEVPEHGQIPRRPLLAAEN